MSPLGRSCGWTLSKDERAVILETDAMRLTIGLDPFAMTFALPDGRVFARERGAHAVSFGARGLRHAFQRDVGDRYYGLGDKTGKLDLHGRRLRIAMRDSLNFDPETGDPLYKHWPFLIVRDGVSGAASGLFYDNMTPATFDLGCEHDNYYGRYRAYEAEGGDLDFYVFPGPSLADVTRKFVALTGRPALLPRWSLGFAQTAMAIADAADAQAQMEGFIARCKSEDIPISAFHLGSGYTSRGPRRYVFNWNYEKYPEPKTLIRAFHDAGMRVVANVKPCLLDDHPRFHEVEGQGAFIVGASGSPAISQFWDGEGAHVDFTGEAGVAWWQKGLSEQVLGYGIDSAWNDNNEYSLENDDATCAGFGAPAPLAALRPLQALAMTRASVEEQRRQAPNERAFTVTRAGCPGLQRYAQTWSGDNSTSWRSLKWNLRTGLQMAMSGMFATGHDIGGFSGPAPDAELLIRWTQAGVLHPRFLMNSWKPDGVYTSPWLHPEATPAVREAIRLRYRLMPYLYSLMHRGLNGEAPLRPTFVAFPDDAKCFEDCDDLMLGPSLLAAPVVAPGARARRVYLPKGPSDWFDFWGEERFEPGAEIDVAAPLDRLPLLAPAGAIVPMTDAGADYSKRHDEPSRKVLLFPGMGAGANRFTLFEDDGLSASGPTTKVMLELVWSKARIAVSARVEGAFALPYKSLRIVLRQSERRKLQLTSFAGAPALTAY